MRRLNRGRPLRAAMRASGLSVARLAEATKAADPTGEGLSPPYVGFIVGAGKSSREECSDRAAELIADVLGMPVAELFDANPPVTLAAVSTSTGAPHTSEDAPPTLQLLTQVQLAGFLQKSSSWIDKQIQADAEWPVHYAGKSRRFDAREVLAHLARRRAEKQAAVAC